jgi:hypothetical protein
VSENLLSELEPAVASLVDELHDALALYVPDEVARREEPRTCIGPADLLQKVRKFEEQLRMLGY